MQEPRRRRRLQFYVLSVVLCGVVVAACGSGASQQAGSRLEAPGSRVEASRAGPAPVAPEAPPGRSAVAESAPPSGSVPLEQPVAPPAELPVGTKVLQVGDSFAAALGIELGKRLRAVGVRTSLEYKDASYVPTWAFGPELPKMVAAYNPDLVLITLGANELEIADPAQRAGAVKRLVQKLGDRPCVWILPPLWKPDTGLMQVIKDNARPCKVLDSSTLVKDLPRGPDKIHPNTQGREVWAEAVFQWLKKSRAPAGPKPWSLVDAPPT
jgi:hypothetical protein